jgi:hypothetical protein
LHRTINDENEADIAE